MRFFILIEFESAKNWGRYATNCNSSPPISKLGYPFQNCSRGSPPSTRVRTLIPDRAAQAIPSLISVSEGINEAISFNNLSPFLPLSATMEHLDRLESLINQGVVGDRY
jgi:hypothetical protein